MANPTTNYGWPMPTSTDLVTDLPADFALFGQPVDTSLKALNPETTLGDIAYRSSTSNTNTRLGIGSNGQVLAVSGGVPAWTTTADVTPLTTKGDLFTFSTVDARLAVGTNGQVLTADSSEATGLKYTTIGSSAFVLVKARTAFSSVATTTTTFDNVFSATYSNYIIIIDQFSSASQANGLFQFRNGGTTRSGSDYYAGRSSVSWDGVSTSTGGAGTTSIILSSMAAGANISNYQITYFHPNTASNNSKIAWTGYSPQLQGGLYGGGFTNASGNNDGFILSASTGNITGNVTVYGLAVS